MEWVNLVEYNYNTYPKEGYDVIVSDGIHYDITWYLMSSIIKQCEWFGFEDIEDCVDDCLKYINSKQ